jgi:hypothetical protein
MRTGVLTSSLERVRSPTRRLRVFDDIALS